MILYFSTNLITYSTNFFDFIYYRFSQSRLTTGDIIEIDGKIGRVENIKIRTTRAVTFDNKVLIIPNHKYLTSTLFNWTENGTVLRGSVSVGVDYNSDVEKVKEILLEIADSHPHLMKNPTPKFKENNINIPYPQRVVHLQK